MKSRVRFEAWAVIGFGLVGLAACRGPGAVPPSAGPCAAPRAVVVRPVPDVTPLPAPRVVPSAEPSAAVQGVAPPAPTPAPARYAQTGYAVFEDEGRLWVFHEGSADLADFRAGKEPTKRVTRVGVGPDGLTLLGMDAETLDAYTATTMYGRPGFAVSMEDGRLWVFDEGSKELEEFRSRGEPAKRVVRIGAGPDGRTLVGTDAETLDAYLQARR